METQSIQEYERLEKYYWWFVGRRRIIKSVLESVFKKRNLRILDWGCGPGGNFSFLKEFGVVTGVDSSDESVQACQNKGISNVIKANSLEEFHSELPFDLIVNLDVLEHIPGDEAYLREVRRVLRPDGYILITVPAYQFLWSKLDEALGHQRRYTKRALKKKLSSSGFHVLKCSYFISFLSPAFIAYRLFEKIIHPSDKKTSLGDSVINLPRPINWLFTKILFLEAYLVPHVSLPFGTSILVIAKAK